MAIIPQVITEDRASGGQVIDGSLKFSNVTDTYLTRVIGSESDARIATLSVWIKRTYLDSDDVWIYMRTNSNTSLYFDGSTKTIKGNLRGTSGTNYFWNTDAVFRDTSGWYHIVAAWDTNQATESNRLKIYVNGVLQTLSGSICPQNTDQFAAGTFQIGVDNDGNSEGDYYMSNHYWIAGQQLDASDFGFTDPLTNTWRPKSILAHMGLMVSISQWMETHPLEKISQVMETTGHQ